MRKSHHVAKFGAFYLSGREGGGCCAVVPGGMKGHLLLETEHEALNGLMRRENHMKQPSLRLYMSLSIVAAVVTMGVKFLGYVLTGSVGLFSDAAESVVN